MIRRKTFPINVLQDENKCSHLYSITEIIVTTWVNNRQVPPKGNPVSVPPWNCFYDMSRSIIRSNLIQFCVASLNYSEKVWLLSDITNKT